MNTTFEVKHWEGELPTTKRNRTSKYPFLSLGVNDYFEVPFGMAQIYSMACTFGKRHGRKFSVRANGTESLRVFRVS